MIHSNQIQSGERRRGSAANPDAPFTTLVLEPFPPAARDESPINQELERSTLSP